MALEIGLININRFKLLHSSLIQIPQLLLFNVGQRGDVALGGAALLGRVEVVLGGVRSSVK